MSDTQHNDPRATSQAAATPKASESRQSPKSRKGSDKRRKSDLNREYYKQRKDRDATIQLWVGQAAKSNFDGCRDQIAKSRSKAFARGALIELIFDEINESRMADLARAYPQNLEMAVAAAVAKGFDLMIANARPSQPSPPSAREDFRAEQTDDFAAIESGPEPDGFSGGSETSTEPQIADASIVDEFDNLFQLGSSEQDPASQAGDRSP